MKQTPLALVFLLLLSACGGGGGGGGTAQVAETLQPSADLLAIRALLNTCESNHVDDALGVQDLLVALLGNGAAAPAFAITNINVLQASFSWSIEVDGDQKADLTGTTQFQSANGVPTIPSANPLQLVNALSGDLSALGALLQQMPAGTQFVTTYSGSLSLNPLTAISGDVTLVMGAGGTLSESSGSYLAETGTLCMAQLSWTDLDLTGVTDAGGVPTGTIDVSTMGPSNTLKGTLALDGDNTADLSVSHNDGPIKAYTLDLTTGEVT